MFNFDEFFFLLVFSSILNKQIKEHKSTNTTRLFWQGDDYCPSSELSHTYENNLLSLPLSLGPKRMKEQRAKYHLYLIE